jgi:hypothetical protein
MALLAALCLICSDRYIGSGSPRLPNKPADHARPPPVFSVTLWPTDQRGTSLPPAGSSHQLGFLRFSCDPIQSPPGSRGASLKRRNGAGLSDGGARAMAVCAPPNAGMARHVTRKSSVAELCTVLLTGRTGFRPFTAGLSAAPARVSVCVCRALGIYLRSLTMIRMRMMTNST